MNLLGIIPKTDNKKRIIFTSSKNNLMSLFLDALGSKTPNKDEEQVLRNHLRVAAGYVDALKERTQSRIINQSNAYAQEQQLKKENVKLGKIKTILVSEIDKAQNHMKLIANAESQKIANTGTALQIQKVAASNGVEDPVVFFNVTIDDVTGPYEFILHLLPDRKTPRLWKLSEVISDYYSNGGQYPSLCGLHVNCRCKLTYLPNSFGFDDGGFIKWKGNGHDEFQSQREKHGLPDVPEKISRKKSK